MDLQHKPTADFQTDSVEHKLKAVIDHLPPGGVTLIEIRNLIGQEGLLLLTAFLTLVFLVPVSIPGVSTVFGFAILLVGISRLFKRNLWLPQRIARRVLPSEKLRAALSQGGKWLHRLERITRPQRLKGFVSAGPMETVNNGAMMLGAVLLMAPFGLIPFSNTLPGLALLFLAIGLLQRDGLCILLGHLLNLITIIYFTALILLGSAAVMELFRRLVGRAA